MSRPLLDEALIHPSIQPKMLGSYQDTINEVKQSTEKHPVVVVGMAQNPFCKKARKALENAAVDFYYLEYGSYFKEWYRRLELKMWSGWPTFPMVFVNGMLIGGYQELTQILASGELKKMLAA